VVAALAKVHVDTFKPEQMKIATTDAEAKQLAEAPEDDHAVKVAALVKSLPPAASANAIKLSPVDFEKDDDKHMLYVTAASNLRARNYAIKEANLHETRGIAGKIIPAIATTTALVTGLVCIEYYKLLQKKPLELYRNFAGNLALPSFYFAEPMTAPKKEIKLKTGPWKYSLWDKVEVDIGDVTLQQLVDHFAQKYGLELSMLSFGAAMLYYSFSMPKKKAQERLASKISELIKSVAKVELLDKQKFITLEAQVSYLDDADTEVDIPQIRFRIK
jgi:ubiquitin-activating enzyme E1